MDIKRWTDRSSIHAAGVLAAAVNDDNTIRIASSSEIRVMLTMSLLACAIQISIS